MKHFPLTLLLTLLVWLSPPLKAATNALIFLSRASLEHNREALKAHHAPVETQQAWLRLRQQADRALAKPDPSVMDKGMTPPSGSKHDYLSLSAYWWPDSRKPGGLPWIRKDGQVNPASKNNQSDGVRLASFTADVQALVLTWYLSGDKRYALKAQTMLRRWFLDPESRMNPNLNFAQGVPGKASGRHTGVLDGRYFATRLVDALLLLRQFPDWTAQDEAGMRQWFTDYLAWLRNSDLARGEQQAKNNHGSWYSAQVAGIASYLQRPEVVGEMVLLARQKIDGQILADGTQPAELARTRSFHYSFFNLQALTSVAQLATNAGLADLWHYQNPKGGSLIKALDYMAPFSDTATPWPWKNRERISVRLVPLLLLADQSLHSDRYSHWIAQAGWSLPAGDNNAPLARGAVKAAQRDVWLLATPP